MNDPTPVLNFSTEAASFFEEDESLLDLASLSILSFSLSKESKKLGGKGEAAGAGLGIPGSQV